MAKVELTVIAGGGLVDEPWLWRLARDYDMTVNLKKANIDTDYGWALLELEGPTEEIQRATAWLMTTGLKIDATSAPLAHEPVRTGPS